MIIRPTDMMILPAYQLKGGPKVVNIFPASSVVIFLKGENKEINNPNAISTIPEANVRLSFVFCFS